MTYKDPSHPVVVTVWATYLIDPRGSLCRPNSVTLMPTHADPVLWIAALVMSSSSRALPTHRDTFSLQEKLGRWQGFGFHPLSFFFFLSPLFSIAYIFKNLFGFASLHLLSHVGMGVVFYRRGGSYNNRTASPQGYTITNTLSNKTSDMSEHLNFYLPKLCPSTCRRPL